MSIISLLSDFGTKDHYVGSMKGAILSINKKAKIVDITHEIPKHDIRAGAFILADALDSFPKNSIFLAVVDPGVGTGRDCIAMKSKGGFRFVGPDNGLFTLIADKLEIEEIRKISNREFMRKEISKTFHGRDVMAPIAAHLSKGVKISKIGPALDEIIRFQIPQPKLERERIRGEIIRIDNFGNLVTNIKENQIKKYAKLGSKLKIKIGTEKWEVPFLEAFGEVTEGEKLCYISGSSFLEIAKNRENLARKINVEREDELIISPI